MPGPQITRLDDRLYLIDALMHGEEERLACYLYDTPERVLVEVGPSRTLHHLIAALDEIGIDDVATIVVTHIHLDHAGGAGHLANRFPGARIGVHPSGRRHLIDPSRLWESTVRVYGHDWLMREWGPIEPIAEERLITLEEGNALPLGGGEVLRVLETPGHAKHHVAFSDPERGALYVGDAVGLCFPHGHVVEPVTPPPDFDLRLSVESLRRMAAVDPRFLGFAHFGPNHEPAAALAEAEDRLTRWVSFLRTVGRDVDEAAARLRARALAEFRAEGAPEDVIERYDVATHWPMQAAGVLRWLATTRGSDT